ncbi:MAG: hypothetical protein VW455_01950 [Nitrospinota bacterium]
MSNHKYFYKGRNMVKIRSFIFGLVTTLIFSIAGILSFFVTPGFSLGWQDKEWLAPGCPQTVSGQWASDGRTEKGFKSLSIKNKKVIYTSQDKQIQKYKIIKSSFTSNNQYLEIKLQPLGNEKEQVLKIRPHLVFANSKDNENSSSCLIKVFSFKNEKYAKTDRYSHWNIYRLEN